MTQMLVDGYILSAAEFRLPRLECFRKQAGIHFPSPLQKYHNVTLTSSSSTAQTRYFRRGLSIELCDVTRLATHKPRARIFCLIHVVSS